MRKSVMVLIFGILLTSCIQPPSSSTPTVYPQVVVLTPTPEIVIVPAGPVAYIKDFVLYGQGFGITGYFVLADEKGVETTATSEATLLIWRVKRQFNTQVYEKTFPITRDDFQYEQVGEGQYRHARPFYSFGWISFDEFECEHILSPYLRPCTPQELGNGGTAELRFKMPNEKYIIFSTDVSW